MAKKWQKLAASKRKRISFPTTGPVDAESGSTSSMTEKGHFVVYTTDEKRFVVPLAYLKNNVIRELFKMAEDEFGLPSCGPITLPCDADFMHYIVTKRCSKRCREGIANVLSYYALFTIFVHPSGA